MATENPQQPEKDELEILKYEWGSKADLLRNYIDRQRVNVRWEFDRRVRSMLWLLGLGVVVSVIMVIAIIAAWLITARSVTDQTEQLKQQVSALKAKVAELEVRTPPAPVFVVPTIVPTVAPTVSPTTAVPTPTITVILSGTVTADMLNVRSGPSIQSRSIITLTKDSPIIVKGRSEDRQWLLLQSPRADGWVSARYTSLSSDVDRLTVVLPSTPSPTTIPAPSSTISPTGSISATGTIAPAVATPQVAGQPPIRESVVITQTNLYLSEIDESENGILISDIRKGTPIIVLENKGAKSRVRIEVWVQYDINPDPPNATPAPNTPFIIDTLREIKKTSGKDSESIGKLSKSALGRPWVFLNSFAQTSGSGEDQESYYFRKIRIEGWMNTVFLKP